MNFPRSISQSEQQGSETKTKLPLEKISDLAGGGDHGHDPGFGVEGDARRFAAANYHRTDVNRNISASVTVDLDCLACELPHSYRESIVEGKPLVLILSDQAFPPVVPGNDGNCVVIVKTEDGLLMEIEQAFADIFAEYVSPSGSLPRGSVVLVCSVSHLAARGLSSYVNDLVGTMASLGGRVGTSGEIVPFVPVLLGGVGGKGIGALMRDLLDLDAWIMSSGLGPGVRLEGARRAFWEVIRGGGGVSCPLRGPDSLLTNKLSESEKARFSVAGSGAPRSHRGGTNGHRGGEENRHCVNLGLKRVLWGWPQSLTVAGARSADPGDHHHKRQNCSSRCLTHGPAGKNLWAGCNHPGLSWVQTQRVSHCSNSGET